MPQRTCLECNAPMDGRHPSALRCSAQCRERAKGREKYYRSHPEAGRYLPRGTLCSRSGCGKKPLALGLCQNHYRAVRRAQGVAWAIGTGHNGAKGRADRHGVQYEHVNRLDIYDRDGWTCGICHIPVDPDLKYPHPMSVSLDHVTPISKGGDHLPANLQCSHLSCNLLKRDHMG